MESQTGKSSGSGLRAAWNVTRSRYALMKLQGRRKQVEHDRTQQVSILGQRAWENQITNPAYDESFNQLADIKQQVVQVRNGMNENTDNIQQQETRRNEIYEDFKQRINAIEEQKNGVTEQLDEITRLKRKTEQETRAAHKRMQQARAALPAAQKQLTQMQETTADPDDPQLVTMREQVASYERTLSDLSTRTPELASEIERLQIEQQELQDNLRRYEDQISALKREQKQALQPIDDYLKELRKQVKSEQEQLDSLNRQSDELYVILGRKVLAARPESPELQELYTWIDDLDNQHTQLNDEIGVYEKQIQDAMPQARGGFLLAFGGGGAILIILILLLLIIFSGGGTAASGGDTDTDAAGGAGVATTVTATVVSTSETEATAVPAEATTAPAEATTAPAEATAAPTQPTVLPTATTAAVTPTAATGEEPDSTAPAGSLEPGTYPLDLEASGQQGELEQVSLALNSATVTDEELTIDIGFTNTSDESLSVSSDVNGQDMLLRDAAGNEYEPISVAETLSDSIAPEGGFEAGTTNEGSLTFPQPTGGEPYELVVPFYAPLEFRLMSSGSAEAPQIALDEYPIDVTLNGLEYVLRPIALQVEALQVRENSLTFVVNFVNTSQVGYHLNRSRSGSDARLIDAAGTAHEPEEVSASLAESIAPENGWSPGEEHPGTLIFPRPEAVAMKELRLEFPGYPALTLELADSGIVGTDVATPTATPIAEETATSTPTATP